jgi:hypothetical protein
MTASHQITNKNVLMIIAFHIIKKTISCFWENQYLMNCIHFKVKTVRVKYTWILFNVVERHEVPDVPLNFEAI